MRYQFGPFHLDTVNQRLWTESGEISLRPKVFALLAYLVERAGSLVSKAELLDAIWRNSFVDDHTVSVHIREIRVGLGDVTKDPVYIETRYRRGWVFKAPVCQVAAPLLPDVDHSPAETHTSFQASTNISSSAMPETRYTHSGEVNIAYQVVGNGPVDLVFVMGWVSHLEYFWHEPSFERFLRHLATFSRLILFDKRGTGLSDRVPIAALPTLEQRMDDLRAVMEAVGSTKAVICGVSEGGPLSAVFAATYPEKTLGLVMFGSYARRLRSADYPWGPTPEEHERFVERILREWGGPVGLEERAPSKAANKAFRDWWATYLRMGASPGAAVALTRMNAQVDVRAVLAAVRVPALVMHRRGDHCLSVEQGRFIASLIPQSQFVELPGSDHLPFVGDQDSVINEIRSFLADLDGVRVLDYVLATVLAADFPEIETAKVSRLRTRISTEINWQRGHESRTEALPLLATFDGPARAIRCAYAIRNHARDLGVAFRAGLHTGECRNQSGLFVTGPAVDVASSLFHQAGPGEILTTFTVRDLATGSGLIFADAGEMALTGFKEKQRILLVTGTSRP